MKTGIFLANFQPFHKSHEFIIQKALRENDIVYVFIYNNDISNQKETPFSFKERHDMINRVFPPVIFKDRLFVLPLSSTQNEIKNSKKSLYDIIINEINETNFSLYYSNSSKKLPNLFTKEQKNSIDFIFVDRNMIYSGLSTRNIRRAIIENDNEYLFKTLPCEIFRFRYDLKEKIINI